MAQGTGDQIESKARNPPVPRPSPLQTHRVLRVVHIISSWSSAFFSFFVLLRLALRTLILFPSSLLFHLFSSLLAKSFFYFPLPPTTVSPVYTSLPLCFLLRPAFVSLLSYSSVVPPAPSFRLSFSPHARRPTAVVHRAFALVARTCHSDGYQE